MSGRRWRDWVGPVLLVLALVVVTLVTTKPDSSSDDATAGSSASPTPRGSLALYQWLGAGGYPVQRLENPSSFAADLQAADVLWVIGPQAPYAAPEAQTVLAWLGAGGTLIVAAEGSSFQTQPDALLAALNINLIQLFPSINASLGLQQPVFAHPPVAAVHVDTGWTLSAPAPTVVPLASAGSNPVLATWRYGRGRVFALSSLYPLTNSGLDPTNNGPLAWNLAAQGRGRRQAFDEVHHGYGGADLRSLLLSQPWGWALLYAGLALVAFLVLTGQRLGPPLVVSDAGPRRGTMDYVVSLAGLFHRAGRTEWAAARYAAEFRRALATPGGLDPGAPAAALAADVASLHADIDTDALRSLLDRLDAAAHATGRARLPDGALLRLVQEAEAVRARWEG